MNDLTGTAALIRLILRRDRIRISIWVVSIALLVSLSAVGVKSLFPTQAAIDQAATATQYNAGAIAFNGPAQGLDTLGGQIAFQVGALGMVVVALMSVFMIGRLTRGDEESGRLELVRSLPVGVHAPTFAALIVVLAMSAAVGVLSSASLLAQGLPTAGSLVLGASFAAVGLFFTGVALVAAQITQNTRVVYGSSGALLSPRGQARPRSWACRATPGTGRRVAQPRTPIGPGHAPAARRPHRMGRGRPGDWDRVWLSWHSSRQVSPSSRRCSCGARSRLCARSRCSRHLSRGGAGQRAI